MRRSGGTGIRQQAPKRRRHEQQAQPEEHGAAADPQRRAEQPAVDERVDPRVPRVGRVVEHGDLVAGASRGAIVPKSLAPSTGRPSGSANRNCA